MPGERRDGPCVASEDAGIMAKRPYSDQLRDFLSNVLGKPKLKVHFVETPDSARTLCGRKHQKPIFAITFRQLGEWPYSEALEREQHCKNCQKHPDYALHTLATIGESQGRRSNEDNPWAGISLGRSSWSFKDAEYDEETFKWTVKVNVAEPVVLAPITLNLDPPKDKK